MSGAFLILIGSMVIPLVFMGLLLASLLWFNEDDEDEDNTDDQEGTEE